MTQIDHQGVSPVFPKIIPPQRLANSWYETQGLNWLALGPRRGTTSRRAINSNVELQADLIYLAYLRMAIRMAWHTSDSLRSQEC